MSNNDEGGLFREIVLSLVLPLIKLCRPYEYTVKQVYPDGRADLAPTKSKIAPKLLGVAQWGPAGTRATPRIGSTVAVSFLDGDPGKPMFNAFTPLSTQMGRPRKIEIDTDPDAAGDGIVLAQGTHPCGRGGVTLEFKSVGPIVHVVVTDPNGGTNTWAIATSAGSISASPFSPPADVAEFTIDEGNPEVLV